ncbi:MAG TPA: DUF4389 domain-containing protein, partial [Acidimicrobiales bacterium]
LGGPRLGLGGLVGFLALVAGVHLAIGRRYPTSIFDFVMGMHRWAWRVTAYAVLMRDEYPPFRLDMGGDEPDAALSAPSSSPSSPSP